MPSFVEEIDARPSVAVLSEVTGRGEVGAWRSYLPTPHRSLGRNMQARKSWNYCINGPGFGYCVCEKNFLQLGVQQITGN
jgi:hypothetical protein